MQRTGHFYGPDGDFLRRKLMILSKNAVGNLINRYKAVLGKCRLINTFGSLALAAALTLGSTGLAMAADWDGGNLTVGSGGDQTSLAVNSDAVALTGTLTITDGGTVTVNSPGSISAGDGATPSNGKLLVTGGTLNVNGYSDSRDLQITGGTVNINGTNGNGWRENGLGGYAETTDENDAAISTGLPTLVSGPNTVVNITSANLFGGAAADFATAQLKIADGATVNLMGLSPDENHTKDFDDAGMLFTGKGAASLDKDSANLLITGDSTRINVAQGNHGVFNAGVTHITDGATVDVQGGLLLTGFLNTPPSEPGKTVTGAMPGALDGYTRVTDGGSILVGNKGHLFLNKGMTLDVAADGVLDNGGKVNLYADSTLAYSAGGDHKLTGIVANAGTLSVTDAHLDLTGAELEKFSGTAGAIAVGRVQDATSNQMARADMTDAQLAGWLEKDGSVTVQGTAARHARLHLGENATVDAASITGGSAAVTGKVTLLGEGSIQAQNIKLTGDALAIDSTGSQGNRIKANSLALTPDTPDADFTLASGELFLKGEAGSALGFAGSEGKGLQIADKGILKLGEDANPGGDINANVTSEGVVDVAQGKWTLAAGKTLDIQDGSLTVGGGHDGRSAELNIQGDLKSSAEGDVGHDNGVNVMNNGVLSGDAEKFVTYTDDVAAIAAGLEKIHVANGGTLRLDGLESVNTQQMQSTKTGLLTAGSSGLISYGAAAIEISDADKGTSDGSITGAAAEATSAVLAGINAEYASTGDAITVGGGFGVDALVVTGNTGDVAAAINGNLTLLGNGGQLIIAEGDAATNVSIAAGKNLNLGSTGAPSNGGTLNGNVELAGAGSALNVAAADYTVGDITAGAADTGNVNVSAGGGLTAGAIGTATEAVSSVSADKGALAATSINAGTVTADNGGTILSTGNITAGGVNVNNGSTVASAKTLNTSTVLVTDGSIEAKTLTASADVTVANGKLLATGTVTDASTVAGNLTLTDSEAALGDMAVTGTAAITGSNIVAQSLAVDGAVNVTGGSLVAESLAVADDAAFIDGAQVKADKLTGASGKTIVVGDADDTKGGTTLTVGSLNLAGGNLYVDPAWGLASSNVAVGGFTGATAADVEINGNVGVGMNSMAAIGTTNMGWLAGQVQEATNGAGLTENGVDSALGIYSAQVLDGAHGIIVDGTKTTADFTATPPAANHLDFSGKSLLVVTAAAAVTPDGAISSNTAGGTANIGDGAKLRITDAKVGQDYTVLGTNIDTITLGTDGTGWTGSNFITDSRMINGSFDAATGVLSTGLNSAANVYPKLDGDLVKVLDNAYTADHVGPAHVDSDVKGVRFLSRATSDNFIGNDANLAAKTIESAARIAVAGAVPQMTMAANNAAGAAITQRTSIAQPDGNGMQSVSLNKAEGAAKNGMALWIMPLYQNQNAWSMEAGDSYDLKWHGGLGGVALGGDYTFDNALRAGIAFNIGGGYAEGEGDLAKTTNSFSFWGLGAYAGWAKENFGLTADVNYTSTYNKVKQELPGAMQMRDLKSDITAYALSTGLRAEYKLNTQYVDIIPHLGVRYMYVSTDSYDVKSNGTVMRGDEMNQNIWTFPIGVTFSKQVETGNGWYVKPNLDLGIIPATGDIEARSKIRFTGTGTKAELDTHTMDYMSYTGGLGLDFGNDNLSLGVNYNIQASEHSTSHGVFGTVRYEF